MSFLRRLFKQPARPAPRPQYRPAPVTATASRAGLIADVQAQVAAADTSGLPPLPALGALPPVERFHHADAMQERIIAEFGSVEAWETAARAAEQARLAGDVEAYGAAVRATAVA